MVTKIITPGFMDGRCYNMEYRGKSTDAKPTDAYNGSLFKEMDTGKVFMFDAETQTWMEQ